LEHAKKENTKKQKGDKSESRSQRGGGEENVMTKSLFDNKGMQPEGELKTSNYSLEKVFDEKNAQGRVSTPSGDIQKARGGKALFRERDI